MTCLPLRCCGLHRICHKDDFPLLASSQPPTGVGTIICDQLLSRGFVDPLSESVESAQSMTNLLVPNRVSDIIEDLTTTTASSARDQTRI
jgi:hypothetical protein